MDAAVSVGTTVERFALRGAQPHPFRPGGRIVFELPQAAAVTLRVFDLRGRLIETLVDGTTPAGRQEIVWPARGVAHGMYFVDMRSGAFRENRRLVVVR